MPTTPVNRCHMSHQVWDGMWRLQEGVLADRVMDLEPYDTCKRRWPVYSLHVFWTIFKNNNLQHPLWLLRQAATSICQQQQAGRQAGLTVGFAELARLLVYLLCQLACWCQHEADGPCTLVQLRLVHDVHQHGQHKRRCLARASLGKTLHTTTNDRPLSRSTDGVSLKVLCVRYSTACRSRPAPRACCSWQVLQLQREAPHGVMIVKQSEQHSCTCSHSPAHPCLTMLQAVPVLVWLWVPHSPPS